MPKTKLAPDDIVKGTYFTVLHGPKHKLPLSQGQLQLAMITGKEPEPEFEEDTSLVGKVFLVDYFRPPSPILYALVLDKPAGGRVPQQIGPFVMDVPAPQLPPAIALDFSAYGLSLGHADAEMVASYKKNWGTPDVAPPKPKEIGGSARELMNLRASQESAGEQNGATSSTRHSHPR